MRSSLRKDLCSISILKNLVKNAIDVDLTVQRVPYHSIDDSSDAGLGHVGHHFGQQVSDKELRHTRTGSFGHLKGMEQFVQRTFASYASAAPIPL